MNKAKTIIWIIFFVGFAYIMLMALQPFFNEATVTANTTIGASSNWSDYSGTQAVLEYWPFGIWFVPAAIGTAAVVITLKRGDK